MFINIRILTKPNTNYTRIMNVFTQKLNPITGISDWIVQNENYDYHQEVARSSFADMLHDTERNKKYEEALKLAINHMHSKGKKANVLDIGTGTGLLSMMAVRHGADTVTACEAFEPMSECAKKVIKLNNFDGKIVVISKRSNELNVGEGGDMQFKANILVTEVFDTELIGEGALNTFKTAHEKLLEVDCIVVPQSATMFAQVIESPFIKNWNKLKDVYDEDGKILLRVPDTINECPGATAVHDVQLSQLPFELFNTIVSPKAVFSFDWSGNTPLSYERHTMNRIQAERDGTAHAVFMWWELNMDFKSTIKLSCAPFWAHPNYKNNLDIPWRDHWMQAIYYLPNEVKVNKGEELNLVSFHDEFSVWFDLRRNFIEVKDRIPPFCSCNLHLACPRTRIGQLNDGPRTKRYLSALQENVKKDSVVLILSHGFHIGLCAAKMNAKKVYILEPSMLLRSFLQSFVDYNKLGNVEIIENVNDLSDDVRINLIFGEPHFTTSILPWDNLQFVYLIKEFRRYCDDDVKIVPKVVHVKGVAVEFKDLHKIRTPLGQCEGFSMKPFDDLIQTSSAVSDDNIEAQPLWEYPCVALSEPVDVATMSLDTLLTGGDISESGRFEILVNRKCNGIALWVDWCLDDSKNVVSTGPIVPITLGEPIKWNMHIRQGVHLINNLRTDHKCLSYVFKFQRAQGNISFIVS